MGVLAARGGDARRWVDGLALGVTAVALLALVARLFPNLIDAARTGSAFAGDARPSWPIDYWNGLSVFAALAFPGLLRIAASGSGHVLRSLPVAATPALAALIYLTSSRTGVITLVVGLALFLLLTHDRGRAVVAVVAGGLGSAGAIAVLLANREIVDGPLQW